MALLRILFGDGLVQNGLQLRDAVAIFAAGQHDLPAAVEQAKEYISGALAAMLDLGAGSGPMDHGFAIHNAFTNEKEV